MFKSIFNKLLFTNLIIIVVIIFIISLVLSTAYNIHVFDEKEKSLKFAAEKVNDVVNSFNRKEISKKELEANLNSMGYITDSSIYVLNITKESLGTETSGGFIEENLIEDLRTILNDNSVFRKEQYSKIMNTSVVFYGLPLKVDGKINGAIVLFSPMDNINSDITRINLIIWGIALIAVIISGIFIYFNSRRISSPIRKIDNAARKIALGEETRDIEVVSQDEVGQLAITFNFMKNKLMEIENIRREFIANVSHDLKAPLSIISAYIEGITEGVIEPKDYNETFKVIQGETKRLTDLTNDILQLSKIQSGVFELSKEFFSARDFLSSIINNSTLNMKNKEINIDIKCPNDFLIYADIDKLKQVLLNLISNSIKYSNDSVKIEVHALEKEEWTEFKVKDNGIGIEQEKVELIFEKFYRVGNDHSSKVEGTGLGLNIVKNLIELHGGNIHVNSEIGKGTEITFTLPKKLPEQCHIGSGERG